MLVMLSVAVPVFVKVADCPALVVPTNCVVKVKVLVLSETAGAMPVPDKLIVCGEPVALSVIETVAVRVPVAVGVNVTVTVQVPFAGMELTQLEDLP